jgi:hypothetical protein
MRRPWIVGGFLLLGVLALALAVGPMPKSWATAWQPLASPGPLSGAHAFLEKNCVACHTPGKGVEAASCIACHAANTELLSLPRTAFHARISTCTPCHLEHQGLRRRPTAMDHEVLARARETHPNVSPEEAILDCARCHATQDPHAGLFGQDCARCHATAGWALAEFRHPSPRSTQCAQCHQAPPSHFMEHFRMVSARVARQPAARVEQCYQCHQVDAWNNIKKVGWYKHH